MDEYASIIDFWQQKNIHNVAELETALSNHVVLFAYHSGKIENDNITYNDTREIFGHDGVTSYTGDLRTLFEIRNAKDASIFVLNSYEEQHELNMDFIKKLHYELTKGTYDARRYHIGERPGEFKKHDYVTGKEEVGALPEDVEQELSEVLTEVLQAEKESILTIAAYFHAKFENIHPFADGNGRTGRLAMNFLLIKNNHPPIIFHEENRKLYYDCLEVWDKRQELNPMKLYLKMETVKTWEKQVCRRASLSR